METVLGDEPHAPPLNETLRVEASKGYRFNKPPCLRFAPSWGEVDEISHPAGARSAEPSLHEISLLMHHQYRELNQRLDDWMQHQRAPNQHIRPSMFQSRSHSSLVIDSSSTNHTRSRTLGRSIQSSSAPKTTPSKRESVKDYMGRSFSDPEQLHIEAAMREARTSPRFGGEPVSEHSSSSVVNDAHARVRRLVGSVYFEPFFAVAIVSSSLFIGVQVEYTAATKSDDMPPSLKMINYMFTIVFFFELMLRLLAHGLRVLCSEHDWMWYWLDVIIVGSSLAEMVVAIIGSANSSDSDSTKNVTTFRIARIIRVTRLVRVLRVIRLVRFVRALRTLVSSILCTLKSLAWAMLLLTLVMFVFSILLTQATVEKLMDVSATDNFSSRSTLERYCGSMGGTMLTLFMSITGGLSWDLVAWALKDVSPLWLGVFLIYIVFAFFAVLNVMTGVFCQSAIESAQRDQDMVIQMQLQNKKEYCRMVGQLFKKLDEKNSGTITLVEIKEHLQDKRVRALFDSMELEADDAWTLFSLIDIDESGVIDIEEFVDGCCRLRGAARSIELARLSKETKSMRQKMLAFMKFMEVQIGDLHDLLYDEGHGPRISINHDDKEPSPSIDRDDGILEGIAAEKNLLL